MNNERRKALSKLSGEVRELAGKLEDLKSQLEELKGEEEEYRDNMPENLHGGDKYAVADAAVNALDSAIDGMPDLEEVAGYIDQAAE